MCRFTQHWYALEIVAYFECPFVQFHLKQNNATILIASGVGRDGKQRILGVSVALSEAEQHWRLFLEELIGRGMTGVQLIVSDDHYGLRKARQAVFTGTPWQR